MDFSDAILNKVGFGSSGSSSKLFCFNVLLSFILKSAFITDCIWEALIGLGEITWLAKARIKQPRKIEKLMMISFKGDSIACHFLFLQKNCFKKIYVGLRTPKTIRRRNLNL